MNEPNVEPRADTRVSTYSHMLQATRMRACQHTWMRASELVAWMRASELVACMHSARLHARRLFEDYFKTCRCPVTKSRKTVTFPFLVPTPTRFPLPPPPHKHEEARAHVRAHIPRRICVLVSGCVCLCGWVGGWVGIEGLMQHRFACTQVMRISAYEASA